jgi:hypothetical protein
MACYWHTHTDGKKYFIPDCSTMVFQDFCSCALNKKDRLQILEEKVLKIENKINEIQNNDRNSCF